MPMQAYNGGSVMVWGCISARDRSDLVIVPPPAMTSARYISAILQRQVLPLSQRRRNFIFMQDNIRPHVSNLAQRFFERHNITLLHHPACSPDLNPIKHVWDEMGRRLRDRDVPPRNLEELEENLQQIWREIP